MFKSRRGDGNFVNADKYAFEDFVGIKVSKSHWSGKFKPRCACVGAGGLEHTVQEQAIMVKNPAGEELRKTVPAGLELTGPNTLF